MRGYTLQYQTHAAPPEKVVDSIRTFPGVIPVREETYSQYSRLYSFKFEHQSNDLTLNMFKVGSPWCLFRDNLEMNPIGAC